MGFAEERVRWQTIEGARELCGVATAGQLGFLQPLTETFKVLNADKNIEELMAAAARRTAENRGWATNIVIF